MSNLLQFGDSLKLASFFGLFPCYFDKDGKLQARNRWAFYLRSLFFSMIPIGGVVFSTWYLLKAAPGGATLYQYLQWYVAGSPTFLDKVAFYAPVILTVINGIAQIFVIGSKANTNVCLQEKFEEMPKGSQDSWNIYKNVILIFGSWLCLCLGTLVLHWRICKDNEIPFIAGIIASATQCLTFLYFMSALAVFLVVFQSRVENFLCWNRWLQRNLKYQTLVTCGNEYIEALNYANGIGASTMFYFCFSITLLSIAVFFRAFSFGLDLYNTESMNWDDYVFGSCFVFFGATQSLLLYLLVLGSHKIVAENGTLLDEIERFRVMENVPAHCPAMNYLMKRLQAFEGFSANDYFYLNKPLITGILANFITYFIILVQFKLS